MANFIAATAHWCSQNADDLRLKSRLRQSWATRQMGEFITDANACKVSIVNGDYNPFITGGAPPCGGFVRKLKDHKNLVIPGYILQCACTKHDD